VNLAYIINKDIIDGKGVFHKGIDSPEEVKAHVQYQGSDTSFNTYMGIQPFLK
jgi:hypothetical protein